MSYCLWLLLSLVVVLVVQFVVVIIVVRLLVILFDRQWLYVDIVRRSATLSEVEGSCSMIVSLSLEQVALLYAVALMIVLIWLLSLS